MNRSQKILVVGGDGFCGWPTALNLADAGHDVIIIDNLSRRAIEREIGAVSLTPIASISDRVAKAAKLVGNISFRNIDVARQYDELLKTITSVKPDTIIHFGEQRAAPYSMLGDRQRRYTVDNNVPGTHNILSAIVESRLDIHLVHLGTMGVYGYSKQFGAIPEGYLDITINATDQQAEILYPANPGSVYHMTKCLDQLLFAYYVKNWHLKITDLHQGIVWGTQTAQTCKDETLINRFDYDGEYGTVLNRFIVQAEKGHPLTVYGTSGQKRALIHVSDTAACIRLAVENANDSQLSARVRIFNQVSEVRSVLEMANYVADLYGAKVGLMENPRAELAENDLEVSNEGLRSLGFKPITLDENLVHEVTDIARKYRDRINGDAIMSKARW
ncbi:MAG: NAD-dependent epimerase/dehydratase family protein [Rhodobacteraceae bacterium]|nr:NAD-dependent epimerase/dehydratase family protein [Paracoccaceae bacterium]